MQVRNGEPPLEQRAWPGYLAAALVLAVLSSLALPLRAGEIGVDDFRISTVTADGHIIDGAHRVAVAYNETANQYLVVWDGADSPQAGELDPEIWGRIVDAATGLPLGTDDFRISQITGGSSVSRAEHAAVAYNALREEYLVVWEANFDNTFEYEIYGQRLDATGAEIGVNDFRISDMGLDGDGHFDADRPAAAFNEQANEYLVVWRGNDSSPSVSLSSDCTHTFPETSECEIFGQRIDGDTGAELGENDFRISSMGPDGNPVFDATDPDLLYNAVADEYLVVWSGDDDTGALVAGEHEIWGQRLEGATGVATGGRIRISDLGAVDGVVSFDAEQPVAAFNSLTGEYLVVWAGFDDEQTNCRIFGQRLDAEDGAELGVNDFCVGREPPGGGPFYDAEYPAVAFNPIRELYLVSWNAGPGTALGEREFEILVQRFDGTSLNGVGPRAQRVSEMGPDGDRFWDGWRSAVAYNAADDEFLVLWEGDDDRPPLGDDEVEIFGQRLLGALGAGGSVTGLDGRRVSCRNRTVPQELTLSLGASTSFACTAAGLDAVSGDRLDLRLDGAVVDALRPVGGTVTGLAPDTVVCRNFTTGEEVALDPAGLLRWDCEAAGLVVTAGDRIRQRVGGEAD